jgi:hypothetical protein
MLLSNIYIQRFKVTKNSPFGEDIVKFVSITDLGMGQGRNNIMFSHMTDIEKKSFHETLKCYYA